MGYWQIARIHAALGLGQAALWYGRQCLEYSQEEEPFYKAYACEAIARAAAVSPDTAQCDEFLAKARELASQVVKADEKAALEKDLVSVP